MIRAVVYDSKHQAVRRAMLAVSSPSDPCARCGRPLGPDPRRIDLGHRDDGAGWAGLEHSRCNRQAGARLGNARRRQARQRRSVMVTAVALGIEVSEDRQHCSIVAAGTLDGDLVLLELLAYLDGTDPVSSVLAIRAERTERMVVAVAVDPHSSAATCIRPLEAAKVKVTKPTSSDLVVAHGSFLDTLAAGRIRHKGQERLTAAVRHLEQRRLGGATAPERRGAAMDVAPAVAAELAAWALAAAAGRPRPMLVVSSPDGG